MLALHKGILLLVGQAREARQSSVKDNGGEIPTQHTSDCLAQYDIPPFYHANWHPNRIQSGGLLEETRLAVVNESRFSFLFLCENEKTVRKKNRLQMS